MHWPITGKTTRPERARTHEAKKKPLHIAAAFSLDSWDSGPDQSSRLSRYAMRFTRSFCFFRPENDMVVPEA